MNTHKPLAWFVALTLIFQANPSGLALSIEGTFQSNTQQPVVPVSSDNQKTNNAQNPTAALILGNPLSFSSYLVQPKNHSVIKIETPIPPVVDIHGKGFRLEGTATNTDKVFITMWSANNKPVGINAKPTVFEANFDSKTGKWFFDIKPEHVKPNTNLTLYVFGRIAPPSYNEMKLSSRLLHIGKVEQESIFQTRPNPETIGNPIVKDALPKVLGDANSDGEVNEKDFEVFKTDFGKKGAGLSTDFNNDGKVDLADFGILKQELEKRKPVEPPTSSPEIILNSPANTNDPAHFELVFTVNGKEERISGNELAPYRVPPGPITEGENLFRITRTLAGKSSTLDFLLTVDTKSPEIIVLSPDLTSAPNQYVLRVNVDGKEELITGASLNTLCASGALKEGENILKITRTDLAGNKTTIEFILKVDTTFPELQITTPLPLLTNGNLLTVYYKIDGSVEKSKEFQLKEGENLIQIDEVDSAGNLAHFEQIVTLDTLAPNIQITRPVPSLTNNHDFTLYYKVDSGSERSKVFNLREGINSLRVAEKDAAGNETVINLEITLDSVVPQIVVTRALPSMTNNNSLTVYYKVDGGTEKAKQFTLQEGLNSLALLEADMAGNQGRFDFQVTLDTKVPQIGLSQIIPTITQNSSLTVFYRVDGGAEKSKTFTLTEGDNALSILEVDAAGNQSEFKFSIKLDTVAPQVQSSRPVPTLTNNPNVTIYYKVDGGAEKSKQFTLQEGSNALRIDETDAAGNIGQYHFSIDLDTTAPQILILSPNQTDNANIYVLRFTVDGHQEEITGTALNALRVPPGGITDGNNNFAITRTDAAGNAVTANFSLNVVERAMPTPTSSPRPMPEPDPNFIPIEDGVPIIMPDDTPLASFIDPYAGQTFRTENIMSSGILTWTKKYYSTGELREIYYHTGEAAGNRTVFYKGNTKTFGPDVAGNTMIAYYRSVNQTHYYSQQLKPGTTLGYTLQQTNGDGVEYRFTYYPGTNQRKIMEIYQNGVRQSRTEYFADNKTKLWVDYTSGQSFENYASGVRKWAYTPANKNNGVELYYEYYDEPFKAGSPGYFYGRVRLHYSSATGEVSHYLEYWDNTDKRKVMEIWKDGVLQVTHYYFEDGRTLRYKILPDWRRQSPYAVDANGLPIMPSSDERLNSMVLVTSDQIATSEEIYTNYAGFIKNGVHGLDGDKWAQEEARYIETIQNLRQNHPELILGSYISLQFGTNDPSKMLNFPPNQFIRSWAYEKHGGIRLTDADLIDYTNAGEWYRNMGHDWGFDLSKENVRRWLAAFHIDKALEYQEKYGIAVYHVDNFGIHYYGTNPVTGDQYAVEIGRMIKEGLNAHGILFEANVGGDAMTNDYDNFRFLMANGQRVNTMADLQEDIASALDARSIEGPYWMEQRNVEQTINFFENARDFLDQGKTLLLLSASYYGKNIIPHSIDSIQNATMDTPVGTRRGIVIDTKDLHSIYPMAGSGTVAIRDLPDAYNAWESDWYVPMEIPGQPDKVFLYHAWVDVPAISGTLTNAGQLFNRSEDERTNAAVAMLIREPGDRLYVTTGMAGDETITSTELDHDPANWKTWPMQFGQALGSYEITEHRVQSYKYCSDLTANNCETRTDDRVITIQREFQNCTFIYHPQTSEVEIIWKNR